MQEIETIKAYIEATPAAALPYETAEEYDASFQEALALAAFARTNALEAISIAITYGRALGLRMGRIEAREGANT